MSLPIYVSLHCNFIMMESVLRSVWKRERATSPPGTSPGSAMIHQRAMGVKTFILTIGKRRLQ
jgi:hypothetical protein